MRIHNTGKNESSSGFSCMERGAKNGAKAWINRHFRHLSEGRVKQAGYHNYGVLHRFGKVMHIFHKVLHKGKCLIYQGNWETVNQNYRKNQQCPQGYPQPSCRHNPIIFGSKKPVKNLADFLRLQDEKNGKIFAENLRRRGDIPLKSLALCDTL